MLTLRFPKPPFSTARQSAGTDELDMTPTSRSFSNQDPPLIPSDLGDKKGFWVSIGARGVRRPFF